MDAGGPVSAEIVIETGPNGREPCLARARVPVSAVVRTAYRDTPAAAERVAEPALSSAEVRGAIAYCAAERCVEAGAFCRDCRKRTDADGLATLDQFCAQFAAMTFSDTGLALQPGGPRPAAAFPSLAALARDWQGEEYWFLARRVIRRIRKEEDPRPKRMAGAADDLPDPVLILVRPQLADNIGMVARAMANFGLDDLRLVDPRDGWPNEKARAAASGANFIVDAARAFPALETAIGDLNFVCATTARQRDLAKPVLTPEQAVQEIRRRMDDGQRCGIVFGPERAGLETDEVAVADAVIMVPVNPRFASLNLAQAALLLGYEWLKETRRGSLGRVTTYETPLTAGQQTRGSPPATKEQLVGFFEQLEEELERLGFFNPPHKRQTVVRNIRTMFSRIGATEQEVRTLRGIVATLSRGKGAGRKSPT
jgi:tRNA/rRNA methyltransferase